ncbi:MAG: hypothetical protein WBZ19_02495 [Chthoniobacterales bacterium]
MKNLVSATLVAAAAIVGLTCQEAHASPFPAVIQSFVPFAQFLNQRSEDGPDGNNRFIWDYVDLTTQTYSGSALWILDPTGNAVGAGNVTVPASVGGFQLGAGSFSNIALHVSSTNNTTLAFAFVSKDATSTTPAVVTSFGTWTYNAQGNLIAFSGPTGFNGLQIVNIAFQKDFVVVTFLPLGQSPFDFNTGPYTVWVLDQFGNLVSAASQGAITNAALGSVTLSGSTGAPNTLWHYIAAASPGEYFLGLIEFSPSGAILNTPSYGPF